MTTMVTTATGHSLGELAEDAWARTGDGSVLVFEDRQWTGSELGARARRLSGGLRAAGLSPGERVVICMANCSEVSVAYHAIWRAGAVVTPVLFLLSGDELRHVLVDSGAAYVVTTAEFLAHVRAASAGVDTLRGIVVAGWDGPVRDDEATAAGPELALADLEAHAEGPLVARDPSDLAALLYTGGTTGRSKGVMISNDALSAAAWAATANGTDVDRLTRSLLPLPLSHAYGLMVTAMALHAADPGYSVLMRWFDAVGWLRLAEQHRTEISAVVPSMVQMILAQPVEDYDLSALRRLASGGAPLPPEVAAQVCRRLPQVEISEGYGCTETAGMIASSPGGQARPGSVGLPAPGVEVRIERPDGSEAAVGEDGEICVRGPVLMTGYWNAPEETERTLRGGWLHTGDVGHFDADGYLYVVDRIKDLIIRGGFNVYPRDVEDALLRHPDVVGAAVVGRPDVKLGEEVVAFVQVRPGAQLTPEEVVGYAREHLSAAKYPREVHLIHAIPLTSVGKTDRKALRAQVSRPDATG